MKKFMPLISITTDFGESNQGIGIMKGVALEICPDVKILDLTHEVLSFNTIDGARQFETVYWLPIGCHVCVVDSGVGTERRAVIIQTKRGDYLVGPDNGVMIPAAKKLGGIIKVVLISNNKYMRHPVSVTFHGRDVFMPAAAWICNGVPIEEFGPKLDPSELHPAAFNDAIVRDNIFFGMVIHIHRKFGTVSTNITSRQILGQNIEVGDLLTLETNKTRIEIAFAKTFADVPEGKELIFLDDYDRTSIAINMGNFAEKFRLRVGDEIKISKA